MATKKTSTQAARIREYAVKHPNATIADIAKSLGVIYQAVYNVLKAKPGEEKVVKHLGVTMAKDDVTKLTEEQTARLAHNMTQGRQRMQEAVTMIEPQADPVNHPAHYKVGGIETIDFIEAKNLNYRLGNVVKYISRADHKGERLENLKKGLWYLEREIAAMSK